MKPEDLENRLKANFPDCDVIVTDLTGTENHFEVRIASRAFNDLTRVQRHQEVMGVFDPELKSGDLHALTLKILEK